MSEHRVELLAHEAELHRVLRVRGVGVLDEVAELGVLVVADGLVQADQVPPVLEQLGHPLRGDVELPPQLLLGRVAAELLVQDPPGALQLVDLLDQVDRQPDGPALVGHRPGDRLPDPPRRVRRELEALGVVELLHRPDQAEVALLDQVQERQPVAGVALGQRDDQPQVGLQQVLLGPAAVGGQRLQVAALGRGQLGGRVAEQVVGVETGLDALGQLDLLLGVEQGDLADLVEVDPDQVGGQRRALLVQVGEPLVDLLDGGRRRSSAASGRTVGRCVRCGRDMMRGSTDARRRGVAESVRGSVTERSPGSGVVVRRCSTFCTTRCSRPEFTAAPLSGSPQRDTRQVGLHHLAAPPGR